MGYCDRLPRSVQLAIACGGIFFSFSYFAVLQEDVYKKPYGGEYFKYTFVALVAERGVNALIGYAGMLALGRSGLTIPHRDIFASGISQMFAMAGSNEALRYVSYPTQVLGKSCKMVPVMAGGIVLGGKRYSLFEYLQVALITIGVCVFNLMGKKKKGARAPPARTHCILFSPSLSLSRAQPSADGLLLLCVYMLLLHRRQRLDVGPRPDRIQPRHGRGDRRPAGQGEGADKGVKSGGGREARTNHA